MSDTRLHRLDTAPVRFLIAGGCVSLINLLLRAAFDLALPFRVAVGIAGVLSVALSFFVYRRFVFRESARVTARAVLSFIAVNLVGLAVTIGFAAAALGALTPVMPGEPAALIAHALGIVAGAAVTFPLYRAITFVAPR